jgi:hypothetical protein
MTVGARADRRGAAPAAGFFSRLDRSRIKADRHKMIFRKNVLDKFRQKSDSHVHVTFQKSGAIMNSRDAEDDMLIEAWIARSRVREMQGKGWRTLGPIRDGMVWMSGPDPAAQDDADGWRRAAAALPAIERLRSVHAAALALHRPHGRRVA